MFLLVVWGSMEIDGGRRKFTYSFASAYKMFMPIVERAGFSDRRRDIIGQTSGKVLEIGAGTGLNLPYYPDGVDLTVEEPDSDMLKILRPKVHQRGIKLIEAPINDLIFSEVQPASFDYVVSTLVLCSVPDLAESLRAISKLLAPGGRFMFVEHVVTPGAYEFIQRIVTPAWKRVAGGCHLDRDLLGALDRSDMILTDLLRFNFPLGKPLIPHGITGTARLKSDFFG